MIRPILVFVFFSKMLLSECMSLISNISKEDDDYLKSHCKFDNAAKNHINQIPQRILDWGSNGLQGNAWNYQDTRCNQIFVDIFYKITEKIPKIKLSPHDLFHGHILTFSENGLLVVFHAKEYPKDLEFIKNQYQIPLEEFYSFSPEYYRRNYVYYSDNFMSGIYLVLNSEYCSQFFDENNFNVFSEIKLKQSFPGAKLVGDINMFKKSNISRIKYNFNSLEASQTGKSNIFRQDMNAKIDNFISGFKGENIVYFLTGIKH